MVEIILMWAFAIIWLLVTACLIIEYILNELHFFNDFRKSPKWLRPLKRRYFNDSEVN